jgi:hypothetical protein
MSASVLDRARTGAAVRLSWLPRLGLFTLLFVCGVAVFFFGCNYYRVFPTNRNLAYEAASPSRS